MECKTLKHVVASAAEAEIAGIFHSAQTSIPIQRILRALGHTQPVTPIKTDNSTASGFIHDNIQQKRSKSWDMLRKSLNCGSEWGAGVKVTGDFWSLKSVSYTHLTLPTKA